MTTIDLLWGAWICYTKMYRLTVHIKVDAIREGDVFKSICAVKENDVGTRITGWQEFDKKYVQLVDEAIIWQSKGGRFSTMNWEKLPSVLFGRNI